jgi:hypothetical protein
LHWIVALIHRWRAVLFSRCVKRLLTGTSELRSKSSVSISALFSFGPRRTTQTAEVVKLLCVAGLTPAQAAEGLSISIEPQAEPGLMPAPTAATGQDT